jgi:hypothetical protein
MLPLQMLCPRPASCLLYCRQWTPARWFQMELLEEVQAASRRYAHTQIKWARGVELFCWLDATQQPLNIVAQIQQHLQDEPYTGVWIWCLASIAQLLTGAIGATCQMYRGKIVRLCRRQRRAWPADKGASKGDEVLSDAAAGPVRPGCLARALCPDPHATTTTGLSSAWLNSFATQADSNSRGGKPVRGDCIR